jgi:hypothetical protein
MAITYQGSDALNLVTDQTTVRSFKRTINAAILLRAARDRPPKPTMARKAQHIETFLAIAGLFVCQHGPTLWVVIHHL